jgi:hypothetical protein
LGVGVRFTMATAAPWTAITTATYSAMRGVMEVW